VILGLREAGHVRERGLAAAISLRPSRAAIAASHSGVGGKRRARRGG